MLSDGDLYRTYSRGSHLRAVVIYELYGKYVCTTTWVAAGYPCLCEHFGTLFWAKVAVLSGMGTVFMGIDTLMNSQKAQSQLKSQHS